ncbi:MAG: hypothetical protein ACXVJD_10330 [Mucilaginibacter sp.]
MLQVKVNEKYTYDLNKESGETTVNGRKISADIQQLNASAFHIISDF